MPEPRRLLAASLLGLALGGLVGLVDRLYVRQSGEISVQSGLNLRFVEREPLSKALARYPKLRPPLYAMLLRLWVRSGLPTARLNETLFFITLALVAVYLRRHLPEIHPLWPLLLLAVGHFNHVNLHQLTAEALVVPLNLVLLLLLLAHHQRPRLTSALGTAVATAALLLSRYFAAFFSLPLAAGHMLLARGTLRRRLRDAALVLVVGLPPVAVWMGVAYLETGHLTGVDRHAPRHFPQHLLHWRELTRPWGNLAMWGKTLWLDFLSPAKPGSLAAVTQAHTPGGLELLVALLLAAGALAALVSLRRAPPSARDPRAPAPLCLEAFALYSALTLAVWSLGNNDPIHSRFLWPSYPFLVLLAFHAHARLRRSSGATWVLWPWRLAYALLVVTQLLRSWAAVPVPVRYDPGLDARAPGETTHSARTGEFSDPSRPQGCAGPSSSG